MGKGRAGRLCVLICQPNSSHAGSPPLSPLRNTSSEPFRAAASSRPNQSTLPAAILATAFCGISLLLIWTAPLSSDREITRYGEALSETLAHSSAGLLLHQERIELAVFANQISQYPEVAGVIFYSASNEIIVLSGNTDTGLLLSRPPPWTTPSPAMSALCSIEPPLIYPLALAPGC